MTLAMAAPPSFTLSTSVFSMAVRNGFIKRYLNTTSAQKQIRNSIQSTNETTQILTFGAGIYGELGTGEYSAYSTPVALDHRLFTDPLKDDEVVDIGCGWASSFARTRNGDIYMWGWPHDHRTSISCALIHKRAPKLLRWLQQQSYLETLAFRSGITRPQLVSGLQDVVQFSSGAGWSAAVTKQGHLLTFGDGFYGQLCHGPKITYIEKPARVVSDSKDTYDFDDSKVAQVSCGFAHTLILDISGQVFSAGRLDCFAVGIGHVDDHFDENILARCTRPQSLTKWHKKLDRIGEEAMGPVKRISTGRNISAFLTDDGCVWTCGKNGSGALGIGSFQSKPFPTRIDSSTFDGERVVDVSCGFYHMVALTESGRVFTWGIANHGQTGRPPQSGIINDKAKANMSGDHRYALYSHDPKHILEGVTASSINAGGYYTAVITAEGLCIVIGGEAGDPYNYLPKIPFGDMGIGKISFGLSHGIVLRYEDHTPDERFRSNAESIMELVERRTHGQQSVAGPFDHFATR